MRYCGTLIITMAACRLLSFEKTWQNNEGSWTKKKLAVGCLEWREKPGGVASINLFPNANVASAWHLHVFLLPPLTRLRLPLLRLCWCFPHFLVPVFPGSLFLERIGEQQLRQLELSLEILWVGVSGSFFFPFLNCQRLLIHHWIIAFFPVSLQRFPFPFVYGITFLGIYFPVRRLPVHTNDSKRVAWWSISGATPPPFGMLIDWNISRMAFED